MKPPWFILISSWILLLFIADVTSFEIMCNSSFTAEGTSFCVGIPVKCTVMLDPDLCIEEEDVIFDEDLEVYLNDSRAGSQENTTFRSMQDNSTLVIEIDYVPMFNRSTIEISVSLNLTTNCSFELTHRDIAGDLPNECLYPLFINVTDYYPYIPAYVRGGDPIQLTVELNASTSLQDLAIFIGCHPALHLKSAVFYRFYDGNSSVDVEYNHTHPYNSSLLLGVVEMENETLYIDLCFYLQAYVLPESDIYFSFRVHYFVPSYDNNSFFQTLDIREVYTTPEVIFGNISFYLPLYDELNRVEFAFPPHIGDLFVIELPITVPCVSTDFNMTLSIPEFVADNLTYFLINVTNVTFDLPKNLLFIDELCNYTNNEPHEHDHSCYIDYLNIAFDRPYIEEHHVEELGVDLLFIDFGPITYYLNCYYNHSYHYNCSDGEYIEYYGRNITCEEFMYYHHYAYYNCSDDDFLDYYGEDIPCKVLRYYYHHYARYYYHHYANYYNCTDGEYIYLHGEEIACEELDFYYYYASYNCTDGEYIEHYGENITCEELRYYYYYNHSTYDNCTTNCSCSCGCGVGEDQITVFVMGAVGSALQNQTLADNMTWEVDHVRESSIRREFGTEINYVTVRDLTIQGVNASSPAISIPINSFSGDAGDSYNLTFGVLHNIDYSSFTAYDLNYTFTVDEHLHPAAFINICFSNGSADPFICEDHPFNDRTIVRNGFHPK